MATDNRGVMVYLPPDVELALADYCTANKLFRKTKDGGPSPSLGTGIVQYLRSQLIGIVPGHTPTIGRDEILELIRESMSSDGLGERLTADDVNGLIEKAIAPISIDLAELLLSIDAVRNNLDDQGADLADLRERFNIEAPTNGEKPTSPKPKKEPPSPSDELPAEVLKVVDRLKREPDLLVALKAEFATGGTAAEIAAGLLKAGHGTVNGGPHSSGAISRFKAAIAHLDGY
jgi:hypothetical protein